LGGSDAHDTNRDAQQSDGQRGNSHVFFHSITAINELTHHRDYRVKPKEAESLIPRTAFIHNHNSCLEIANSLSELFRAINLLSGSYLSQGLKPSRFVRLFGTTEVVP
jgi:hypothetical protein